MPIMIAVDLTELFKGTLPPIPFTVVLIHMAPEVGLTCEARPV